MKDLPRGWVEAKLADICDILQGQSPPGSSYNRQGRGLPFFQGKADFGQSHPLVRVWCEAPVKIAEPGDVLMSIRAPVGPTNVADQRCCIGRGLASVRPLGSIETAFVLHVLRYRERDLAQLGTGSTFAAVSGKQIHELEIMIPPLREQRRIVAEIEKQLTRIDTAIEVLTRLKKQVKICQSAVAHAAINGYALGSLAPSSRTATPITRLGALDRGRSRHRPRDDHRLFGGQYPFIQTSEVRNSVEGFIRNYSATYSQFGLDQSRLWPAGTLCIMIAANIAETGILAFPACFPDSVVGFLADEPGIVRWVELFLRTEKQRLSAYAPATAQKNINLEILRNLSVPIPPPEKLKETIATVDEVLSVTQTAESSINRNLAHAARLRYAILAKAFSGQLVYQDPDDEPASVLLERIRNQRAKQKPQTRSPRPRKRGAPAAQLTLQD